MRLRKFVIVAVILSSFIIAGGCSEGPTTEVRVEPADSKQKQVAPERKRPVSAAVDTAAFADSALFATEDTLPINTAATTVDTLAQDSEAALVDPTDSLPEFLGADSVEVPESEYYEEIDPEFHLDESEIAENRLVSSRVVRVISPELRDSYDSLLVVIEERLTIRPDRTADNVVLEKWRSPVNYKGYKFNMRKLMLFGVEVHYPVRVYHYMGQYYFSVSDKLYRLEVFPEFSPFRSPADTALSRYLLNFEN